MNLTHTQANRLLQAITEREADTVETLAPELQLSDGVLNFMWHYTVASALDKGNIPGDLHRIVKSLVNDLDVDINASGYLQKPILFYYLYYKEFTLAEELIALGADVNVRVTTGRRNDANVLLSEPLICTFIQRMNPERDFPEDFSAQLDWLKARGADETIPAVVFNPHNVPDANRNTN